MYIWWFVKLPLSRDRWLSALRKTTLAMTDPALDDIEAEDPGSRSRYLDKRENVIRRSRVSYDPDDT